MKARFSAPIQTGPGAHPASYTMGTGSFPGVKRPGRGVDHPPQSSAEVKEREGLHLYSRSGPSWPVWGVNFTFTFTELSGANKNSWGERGGERSVCLLRTGSNQSCPFSLSFFANYGS